MYLCYLIMIGVLATLFYYLVCILHIFSEFNANILAVLAEHMVIVFGVNIFFVTFVDKYLVFLVIFFEHILTIWPRSN